MRFLRLIPLPIFVSYWLYERRMEQRRRRRRALIHKYGEKVADLWMRVDDLLDDIDAATDGLRDLAGRRDTLTHGMAWGIIARAGREGFSSMQDIYELTKPAEPAQEGSHAES